MAPLSINELKNVFPMQNYDQLQNMTCSDSFFLKKNTSSARCIKLMLWQGKFNLLVVYRIDLPEKGVQVVGNLT